MRAIQNGVLAALLRARRFATEYLTLLMSVVDVTAVLKRLDDVIASFNTHAVDQDGNKRSAKGETEKQQQLRLKLRTEQMKPIAEIARRNLRTVPEFKALQMPPQSATGPAFLASAKAMANAATIQKDALLERGLPADFLDQFQATLTTLEGSISDRAKNITQRIGATKGLVFQEQEGRSVLKVLDALVKRALRGNDALLATWTGARTIHQRAASASTTPSTTASTPATATTPTDTSTPSVGAAA